MTDPRRSLPSVERVLAALEGLPHALLVSCARDAVDAAREHAENGDAVDADGVVADAEQRVERLRSGLLRPALNATGVIVHTNLGRAPIGVDALAAASDVARGYSNLEYHMDSGTRGSRHEHAGALLARACGAEAGLVVNNNAAAVLLALAALARGREVVVSRGELVEIGGGFRVPEIMAESGCRLVEVGTTNRTRRADYEREVRTETALVLKVHASNYRMVGFTEATPVTELATLGPPVMVDAGSGLLDDGTPWLPTKPPWLHDEPGVRQAIADGATLVTFSGDKLLGGPQAGIVVGSADAVATLAAPPARARCGRASSPSRPFSTSRSRTSPVTRRRSRCGGWRPPRSTACGPAPRRSPRAVPAAKVVDTEAVAGGGSLPGLTIPSVGVAAENADPSRVVARLRDLGVVARIADDAVVCDLRTVDPADDARLADALRRALAAG